MVMYRKGWWWIKMVKTVSKRIVLNPGRPRWDGSQPLPLSSFFQALGWATHIHIRKYQQILNNKQARKLERCATLRWNLRTAVKLAHSQNCRPQSRKKSKWNLCNCDCWKTCTETTANRRDGKHQRGYIQRSYSITQVGSTEINFVS